MYDEHSSVSAKDFLEKLVRREPLDVYTRQDMGWARL